MTWFQGKELTSPKMNEDVKLHFSNIHNGDRDWAMVRGMEMLFTFA